MALPVASVTTLVETIKPAAGRAIERLAATGVLVETTGKKRDRSLVHGSYLERQRVSTELAGAHALGRWKEPREERETPLPRGRRAPPPFWA